MKCSNMTHDFSKSLSLFQKSLSLRFRFFRFFDTSSHFQKNILFLYMNNINDMTDKRLNKTPWSETKMKKYGLTNREYKGRKIIFEDEIISVLKKEYDDVPPNIGRDTWSCISLNMISQNPFCFFISNLFQNRFCFCFAFFAFSTCLRIFKKKLFLYLSFFT